MRQTQPIGSGYSLGFCWGLFFGGIYILLSLLNNYLTFRSNPKTARLRHELTRRLTTASYQDQTDSRARFGFEDAVKLWVIIGTLAIALVILTIAR